MKSKKWLISLGLAVVLVVAFALPACEPAAKSGWYTPGGEKISFEISSPPGHHDEALLIVEDLQDFGLDVSAPPMDSSTFYDILYTPDLDNSLQAFVWADDPAPDPWSDWIWCYFADPNDWGYLWNPCWYDEPEFDALYFENYLATNMTRKSEILMEMQLMMAEDIPVVFLMREDIIAACRTDRWDNWFLEMGGYATWINEYSIREVTNKTADDRLNIAVTALSNSLDMDQLDLQNTNFGTLYLLLVYEPLYAYPKVDDIESNPDAAYGFAPRLVNNYSWSYEDDGNGGENQILTLDLEEGVKWHDGEDFTADDVVFSFKSQVINPWAPNMPINWTWVNSDEFWEEYDDICPEAILVTNTTEHQVELRYVQEWHQPEAYLPNDFLWYSIVPEHVFGLAGNGTYAGWNEDPLEWDGEWIGTGPFKVKEYEVDQYVLLERFDDYWGDLPAAKDVLFKLYEDDNAMWMAFESDAPGSLMDLAISGIPFEKKASYEADPRITVEVVPDLSITCLGFNLHPTGGYAPLAELPLREAIAAAIDKENICTMIAGGYAEPADSWVYLESPYHHDSLPNNTYNPTEAANILTAAGYTFYE
jgi:ABC-type transport system substrate-binding protein